MVKAGSKNIDMIIPGKSHAKKRLLLFKVISVLLPFFILFVLEVLLRLFNYGFNPDLFIENPADNNYLVLNPEASKKYFINEDNATVGNIEFFKKEKDENTLRIFVLGESTTIGYPYFHNGSFHRWLLYRLMHSLPNKNFEIINLSLTAVNSYTVLGFAKEVVNYEPDAILIYTGHNEYYGALGVGSTGKISGGPAIVNFTLALRTLRLVQFLTNVYHKVSRLFNGKNMVPGQSRMELMVHDQQIPYPSKLFNLGTEQFRSNLDATLNVLANHHVPVFISTLVSNEKDLKPLLDLQSDSLNIPGFKNNYAAGYLSMLRRDTAIALSYFERANQVYSSHASCNYYLGRLAYGKGDFKKAQVFFSRALELDALRFRAPAEMNEVIIQMCKKYFNTHLVDAKSVFDSSSLGSIIGDELILEHVHPNLKGFALLSNLYYEALKKEKIISVPAENEISFENLSQDMPITTMDSLTGAYRIEHLKKSWPFTNASASLPDSNSFGTEEEKLSYAIAFQRMSWSEATEELYRYYISNRNLKSAKTLVETLVLEHPTEESYYTNAANICGELKDYKNAAFYFKKSFDFLPSYEKAKYLFVTYFKLDSPQEAIHYLDYGINTGDASLRKIKSLALEIMQLKNVDLKNDPNNVAVLTMVAKDYLNMGNKEIAEKYIQKVLQVEPKNKDVLLLLAEINSQSTHEIH